MVSIIKNALIGRTQLLGVTSFVLFLLAITVSTTPYMRLSYAQTTFPPPIFLKLRNVPTYAVIIPFSALGNSSYEPSEMSIMNS
jgi:hypothetical protein